MSSAIRLSLIYLAKLAGLYVIFAVATGAIALLLITGLRFPEQLSWMLIGAFSSVISSRVRIELSKIRIWSLMSTLANHNM